MTGFRWAALIAGVVGCLPPPPIRFAPAAYLGRCIRLAWYPTPPALVGWAIPDTLQLVGPAWLATHPDTAVVSSGEFQAAVAMPELQMRADWWVDERGFRLSFRLPDAFRIVEFPDGAPVGAAQWHQQEKWGPQRHGSVVSTMVTCPRPTAS